MRHMDSVGYQTFGTYNQVYLHTHSRYYILKHAHSICAILLSPPPLHNSSEKFPEVMTTRLL